MGSLPSSIQCLSDSPGSENLGWKSKEGPGCGSSTPGSFLLTLLSTKVMSLWPPKYQRAVLLLLYPRLQMQPLGPELHRRPSNPSGSHLGSLGLHDIFPCPLRLSEPKSNTATLAHAWKQKPFTEPSFYPGFLLFFLLGSNRVVLYLSALKCL